MQVSFGSLESVLPPNRNVQNVIDDDIEKFLREGKENEALNLLLDSLQEPQEISKPEKCYKNIIILFQFLDEKSFQILLNRLPLFLKLTPNLVEQQYHLAIRLGEQFEKFSDQKNAMICFGKGIKIAEMLKNEGFAREAHLKASALLGGDSKRVKTESYHQQLKHFRGMFDTFPIGNDVRKYQAVLMDQLRVLFQFFLEDAIGVLGIPPCSFDIRATGSIGREEPSPFPSLEFFLLIESEETKKYFRALLNFLELQIHSLGETLGDAPVFTCLGKKFETGFHIDPGGNPLLTNLLIGSPHLMASIQLVPTINSDELAPGAANRVLKSVSLLKTSDPQLFLGFQKGTNVLLDTGKENKLRSRKTTDLLSQKLKEFRRTWFKSNLPTTIDLKDRYSKYLIYFLSELALHWNICQTNTLDIIDALVDKEVFTKYSGEILKQSVAILYNLRNKLHLFYGEQRDEGFQEGLSGYIFNKREKEELEKIYWLVLRPLYHFCLPRVLEERKKIEDVFYSLDFFKVCLEEICADEGDLTKFLPVIRLLASHQILFLSNLENIKKLSKRGNLAILKQTYLDELAQHIDKDEQAMLEDIPDQSGLRQSILRREREFKEELKLISSAHFHRDKTTSQIRIVSTKETRYIKPEIVREILDESSNLKQEMTGSLHRVVSAHGFHFKQKPAHPLMEYAIHSLLNRLAGQLTPLVELVRFDVDGGEKIYPVLISKTVKGITLKEGLGNLTLSSPNEWRRWSWFLIASILTRSGNGQLSNYILDSENMIHCVDNEVSFLEPISKDFSRVIQFSSPLFCLFKDREIDRSVLEEFSVLDSEAILCTWIEDVIKKEEDYSKLFSFEERKKLYEEDADNRFKATILFQEGTLALLKLQFVYLQNQLKSCLRENRAITPIDLLTFIVGLKNGHTLDHSMGITISQAYQKANQPNIDEQLMQITKNKMIQRMTSKQSDKALLGFVPTFDQVDKEKRFSAARAKEELVLSSFGSVALNLSKENDFLHACFKGLKNGNAPDMGRQSVALGSLVALMDQRSSKPLSVTLQNCCTLDSATLPLFLHENLEILDISGCLNIKNRDIELIQRNCPHLKRLQLNRCLGLTAIQESGWRIKPLVFSQLKWLSIEGCLNLKSIRLLSSRKIEVHKDENFEFNAFEILDGPSDDELVELEPVVNPFQVPERDKGSLYHDKHLLLEAVKVNGELLQKGSDELIDDPEIVLAAVNQKGEALRHASLRLRNDQKIVFAAVREFGTALAFASAKLQEDVEIVIAAVQQTGWALMYAAPILRSSKMIVIEAVKQDGWAFKYASNNLKKDREFVLKAVQLSPAVLEHVPLEFKNDREIVLIAIKQDRSSTRFAGEELQKDNEIREAAGLK